MKRLILTILYLLLSVPCFAQEKLAWMGAVGVGGGGASTTNFCNDANAVGCWYMNADGSTQETDRSAAGNNLTVSASDTIPSSGDIPSGYSGYSRDFEWSDVDYMTIADGTELDINGSDAKISISLWMKVESIANTNTRNIVVKDADSNHQYCLFVYGTGGSIFKIAFNISSNGTDWVQVVSSTTDYAVGTWYHIVAVSDDIDLRIYVNGYLDCTPVAHTAGIFNGNGAFTLGYSYNTFDGLMDEVVILNRALSSTEVSSIYTNGITGNKGGSD